MTGRGRPLRALAHGRSPPRQPAHRAARLALRALGRRSLPDAGRGSRRRAGARAVRRLPAARTCARSASTGTARWSGSRSGPGSTRAHSNDSRSRGWSSAASARAARCARRLRRSTARRPRASTPGPAAELTERGGRSAAPPPASPSLCGCAPGGERVRFADRLRGERVEPVDDLVLRRRDGAFAYNLAVVVDDAEQGVGEVVRGDDLLPSTAGQALLCDLLGLPRPAWAHVPLVLGPDGARLAKRHGAVTLADLAAAGWSAADAVGWMAVARAGGGRGAGRGRRAGRALRSVRAAGRGDDLRRRDRFQRRIGSLRSGWRL